MMQQSGRLVTQYQFQVDGRAAGPLRMNWDRAVSDAVAEGYALWIGPGEAKFDGGGTVERIQTIVPEQVR